MEWEVGISSGGGSSSKGSVLSPLLFIICNGRHCPVQVQCDTKDCLGSHVICRPDLVLLADTET